MTTTEPVPGRPARLRERLTAAPLSPPRRKPVVILDSALLQHLDDDARSRVDAAIGGDPGLTALLAGVAAHSPFLTQIMRRDPETLICCLDQPPETLLTGWIEQARAAVRAAGTIEPAMTELRRLKRRAALLIALADCGGVWDTPTTIAALSDVADAAVAAATDWWLSRAAGQGRFAPPDPAQPGHGSGLMVLAMGKHGARELNYSSDIDLVLFFDRQAAQTAGIADPQAFYVRFARDLTRMLQERTADGYVFRVDLRLRPDPASTQPAVSTDAAWTYYETVGQNWERAAFIKARPVAGDIALGERFLKDLAPFIWRKYFDFATIADIHAMKRQIQAVKGHEAIAVAGHDVKLGRGGIREIEFFVQVQQLVFGGRRPALRGPRTRDMLEALVSEGWITATVRDELIAAYDFLRAIEHRLQMRHDEQTQRLPVDVDELAALARFAGFAGLKAFEAAFTHHARRVETHYALLFEEGPSLASEAGALRFTGAEADSETLATLSRLGFRDARTAAETVRGWHFGRRPAVTSPRAREALTELTPALLVAFGRSGDPDAGLNALDQAFARMPAAVELMTILRRHEALLSLFATILGSAPRLARLVAAHPHVLDALIDPSYGPAAFEGDAAARRIAAAVGEPAAFEEALDRLRDAVRPETFVIGARLLSGAFSPERAGAALAGVADSAVAVALAAARREVEAVHGTVPGARVAVMGLGRLGARDLTASSDLDLVILYDAPDMETRSAGTRPLDAVTWHQRLAQRLITALSAATRRGTLYEVDLRLRPAGSKGPLAVRLASFEAYQQAEAELWEHMALTKARIVAGDEALGQAALAVARDVIRRPRERRSVLRDIAQMRSMIAEAKGEADPWDLKLAAGGLTDLDFIAEALILTHAHAHPDWALAPTGAVFRLAREAGVLAEADAATLTDALALLDAVTHMQRLTIEGAFDPRAIAAPVMRLVAKAGGAPDASTLAAMLADHRKAVRAIFRRLIG